MSKKISWTEQAKENVRAIDRATALGLLHGLARFAVTEEEDVKRLQGFEPPKYRLRLGPYRFIFRHRGESIEILEVRHRREAYR